MKILADSDYLLANGKKESEEEFILAKNLRVCLCK